MQPWLVEALTRAGRTDRRRLEQARLLFENTLGYANHLGLYAEQTGAAFNLDRALKGNTA